MITALLFGCDAKKTQLSIYFRNAQSNELSEEKRSVKADEKAGAVELAKISIQYGLWIQAIVDFLIIALSVFAAVRIIRKTERKLNEKEILKKEAEAAQKKAEEDAKAAEAKAAADAKAAEEQAIRDEFYANVREQAALLREIRDSVKK